MINEHEVIVSTSGTTMTLAAARTRATELCSEFVELVHAIGRAEIEHGIGSTDVDKAADEVDVPRDDLWQAVWGDRIAHGYVGGRAIVDRSAVDAWLESGSSLPRSRSWNAYERPTTSR